MKNIILSLLVLLPLHFHAQTKQTCSFSKDTIRLKFYFEQGLNNVDPTFSENNRNLRDFLNSCMHLFSDSLCDIVPLEIVGTASPEGSDMFNLSLSKKRAQAFQSYIKDYIPFDVICTKAAGIDYQQLYELVRYSETPYSNEILKLLELMINENDQQERKRLKIKLITLRKGEPWRYMYKYIFPKLRSTTFTLLSIQRTLQIQEKKIAAVTRTPRIMNLPLDVGIEPMKPVSPLPKIALKTNMLYDIAAVPNIGLEFCLNHGWSIGANWMYAWWSNNTRHRYWRTYGGELYTRRYFGRLASRAPLSGHHVGVYLQGLTYDIEWGKKGYLSKFSYGAGLEYGYSFPVSKRINIDLTLGLGYLGGKFKTYQPRENCYVWQSTNNRYWIGPSKAEISFVWLVGNGLIKERSK